MKTTELGLLLQVLPVRIIAFVETLGSHLKGILINTNFETLEAYLTSGLIICNFSSYCGKCKNHQGHVYLHSCPLLKVCFLWLVTVFKCDNKNLIVVSSIGVYVPVSSGCMCTLSGDFMWHVV